MKFGYARVSTSEQSLENQISNLKKSGCEKIFTDIVSGKRESKPGFSEMVSHLREGDVVVVTSIDRMGRSTRHLLRMLETWQNDGVNLQVLSMDLDTRTTSGKLMFTILAALAESERNLIVERTKKGLEGARSRGRFGGRPKKIEEKKLSRMKEIYDEKRMTIREICMLYNISKTTLYNYLNKENRSK